MRLNSKKTISTIAVLALAALSLAAVACSSTNASTSTPNSGSNVNAPSQTGGDTSGTTSEKMSLLPSGSVQYASYPVVSNSGNAGIYVSGNGVVTLEPDVVFLTLGVEAQGRTVQAAREEAALAMDAIYKVLKARGIEGTAVRTSHFNISPQYSYPDKQTPVIVGYQVNNQVTVKIKDLKNVGVIIDEVATAGGDNTRINGISFSIDDNTEAVVKARELAVKDALAKAQQFATLTGMKLGKLVYITESGGYTAPERSYAKDAYAMGAASAVPTPISGGELEVNISVQAVFAIE
jgi:uncharacterized protein YggE